MCSASLGRSRGAAERGPVFWGVDFVTPVSSLFTVQDSTACVACGGECGRRVRPLQQPRVEGPRPARTVSCEHAPAGKAQVSPLVPLPASGSPRPIQLLCGACPGGGSCCSSAPCALVCRPREGRWPWWPALCPRPRFSRPRLPCASLPRPGRHLLGPGVCVPLPSWPSSVPRPLPWLLHRRGRFALVSARSGHCSYTSQHQPCRTQIREGAGRAVCGWQAPCRSLQRAGRPTSVSSSSGPPPDDVASCLPQQAAGRRCPRVTWGRVVFRDSRDPGGILLGAILSKPECLQGSRRSQSHRVLASQLKQREVGLFT